MTAGTMSAQARVAFKVVLFASCILASYVNWLLHWSPMSFMPSYFRDTGIYTRIVDDNQLNASNHTTGFGSTLSEIGYMTLISEHADTRRERSILMGLALGAMQLGVEGGPFVSGLLYERGGKSMAYGVFVLPLMITIVLFVVLRRMIGLKQTRHDENDIQLSNTDSQTEKIEQVENHDSCKEASRSVDSSKVSFGVLLRDQRILGLILASTVSTTTVATIMPQLATWLKGNFPNITEAEIGFVPTSSLPGYVSGIVGGVVLIECAPNWLTLYISAALCVVATAWILLSNFAAYSYTFICVGMNCTAAARGALYHVQVWSLDTLSRSTSRLLFGALLGGLLVQMGSFAVLCDAIGSCLYATAIILLILLPWKLQRHPDADRHHQPETRPEPEREPEAEPFNKSKM